MRLIDANALASDLTRFYEGEVTARKLIAEQPTIDAVPVVRCKDCKHWDTDWDIPVTEKEKYHYCPMTDLNTSADWYCADGDRKEDVT